MPVRSQVVWVFHLCSHKSQTGSWKQVSYMPELHVLTVGLLFQSMWVFAWRIARWILNLHLYVKLKNILSLKKCGEMRKFPSRCPGVSPSGLAVFPLWFWSLTVLHRVERRILEDLGKIISQRRRVTPKHDRCILAESRLYKARWLLNPCFCWGILLEKHLKQPRKI